VSNLVCYIKEEDRLRLCENRALRRIFGPKRDEVTVGWRKLRTEELHNLYYSPNIVRMRWARRVGHMGEMRSAYVRDMVRNSEGKQPLARPTQRW
jgi:hypothetical protein